MLTKTKIVLAAALLAATSTVTLATANAEPIGSAHVRHHTLQSAPVRLNDGYSSQQNEIDQSDRASSPYAGGVG